MYKPKLDSNVMDKGFVLVRDNKKNYLCCNLLKYNSDILAELKDIEINKFSIEESCEISDFNFLTDFEHLKEIVISSSHKILDIKVFNKLNELQVLGLPQFVGTFSNMNVEHLSFDWHIEENFAENLLNLRTISVHNCDDIQSCIEKIHKNKNLRKVVFNQSNFSSFSCKCVMKNVEEVELQYCNVSYLESIVDTFPNCKSLLIDNAKKIIDYSVIKEMKKLEKLSICSSSLIKDVHFITQLCMLNTLKIISTKIESSSAVSYLLSIPNFSFYQTGIDKFFSKSKK